MKVRKIYIVHLRFGERIKVEAENVAVANGLWVFHKNSPEEAASFVGGGRNLSQTVAAFNASEVCGYTCQWEQS